MSARTSTHRSGDRYSPARQPIPGEPRHDGHVYAVAVERPVRLGLGTSGPQVIEGWHGIPFSRPIQRTREIIEIVRMVNRLGRRVAYDGEVYQLPLPDGEGRSIRSSSEPVHVPIYVAALGPRNLELTGELADGWVGGSFIPETAEVFLKHIRTGCGALRPDS